MESEKSGILKFLPIRKYLLPPFSLQFFSLCKKIFFEPGATKNPIMESKRGKLEDLENCLMNFTKRIHLVDGDLTAEDITEMTIEEQLGISTILASLLVGEWRAEIPEADSADSKDFVIECMRALIHLARKVDQLPKK